MDEAPTLVLESKIVWKYPPYFNQWTIGSSPNHRITNPAILEKRTAVQERVTAVVIVVVVVGIPLEALFLTVTAVVAVNHTSLELCAAAAAAAAAVAGETTMSRPPQQRPMFIRRDTSSTSHGGGEWTRTASDASISGGGLNGALFPPRNAIVTRAPILFAGDIVGSAAGPLLLAPAVWARRWSPLGAWLWLVLCLCGDVWLVMGSREAEPQHATLLGSGDEQEEEEVEEERRRSQRFAHFV